MNTADTTNTDGQPESQWRAARKAAAHRQRRVIIDDDGDMVYDPRSQSGPDAFCELRLKDYAAASVDSLSWCMMWAIATEGATATRYWQTQKDGVPFQDNMPDPTATVAQFCREQDMEVFGSIRMNDCHDAYSMPFDKLIYPLKVAHPEFLLGDESQRGNVRSGLPAAMWSGLNYAHPEVRADRLWWIQNTASAYDLDGVDLNFFRMPWLFKPGEEAEHMHLLTDFIREARECVDAIGRQRGRPVLLGVRIPGTLETCLRIGIDIETWLKEGYVDRLLTGGGYAAFSTPAEELIDLGHRYEIPVYPCINCPMTHELGGTLGFEALRGAASNLWWAGADGLYLWNYQYLPTPHVSYGQPNPEDYGHLWEIADPKVLKRMDKVFAVNDTTWVQYARASATCPLPMSLNREDEPPQIVPTRIGDDIPAADRDGVLKDVTLQIKLAGITEDDRVQITLNDFHCDKLAMRDGDSDWLQQQLDPSAVKQGDNCLEIGITQRDTDAQEDIVLEQVSVIVRYHG